MPLRAILIDQQILTKHGSMNQPLEGCLREAENHGLTVVDIGIFSETDNRNEIAIEEMKEWLGRRGLSFCDCLMIADCEESVRQAKNCGAAVLGYEPEGCCRIQSHLDMIVQGFEEIDLNFLVRVYQRFFGLPWDIVETDRCLVREMTLQDLDALYELYRPQEVTRYLGGLDEDRQKEEARLKDHIRCMYRFYGYGMWAVVEKSTGRLIGRAGFGHLAVEDALMPGDDCFMPEKDCPVVEDTLRPELGYLIAADKQCQGYATEVCRAILDYGWRELGFSQVYCRIREENHASVHLAEKLGFVREKCVAENGKSLWRMALTLQDLK